MSQEELFLWCEVGVGVGVIFGIIVGQIFSEIFIWKRPWRQALKFWRME